MADTQLIFTDSPGSLPASYQLPPGLEIALQAVRAKIDGSGAGSAFYPCLSLYSQDGKLIARVRTNTAYNAGDSGEVTFAPFLGVEGAASGATLLAARVQLSGDFTVTTGDPGTVVTWGEAAFDLGDPTPFWSASTPKRLYAPVSGYYLSLWNGIWDVFGTNTDGQLACYLYKNTETPTVTGSLAKVARNPNGSTHFTFQGEQHGIYFLNAGDYLVCNAYCNTGTGTAFGSIKLLDLRTHAGQPSQITAWQLVLVAPT